MSSSEDYEDISFDAVTSSKPIDKPNDVYANKPRQRFNAKKKMQARDKLSGMTRSQRRESAKVRQFTQIVSELTPLFYEVKQSSHDSNSFKANIRDKFQEQKDIVEALTVAWGLDNAVLSDRVVISQISKSVAALLANGMEVRFKKEDILQIGHSISDMHRERLVFGELLEEDLISSDILVNIKSVMLPSCVRLRSLLSDLMIGEGMQRTIYREYHKIAYDLAKDIAFNWDKDAMIEDRESLFVHILASAADVIFVSLKEQIVENVNSGPITLDSSLIWSWLEDLNKEILNNDMGYQNHPDMDIYWLKKQLGALIINKVEGIQANLFTPSQRNVLQGFFLKHFEEKLIESWSEESSRKMQQITEMLEGLSDEEQQELFSSEEFLRPMDIRPLFDNFHKKVLGLDFDSKINIDFKRLKSDSSKNFAMFWGLSDAVCKLRSVS